MKNGIDIKRLILWSLYNFAHAIALIVFFFYYSQWLVIDRGVSDLWFNMTFVGSSVLFLLTVPVAAAIADKTKVQMRGLRITTLLSAVFFFLTGFVASIHPEYYILSICTFSLATYFYLFSYTYYHPLLNQVAEPHRQGLASGWGWFGDWAGEITGLVVTLPLATGSIILWGSPGRAATLMPATILFFVCALPMLIFFKEKTVPVPYTSNLKKEYTHVFRSFVELCALPGVGLFFLAYFFFNDAITTASNNFPIYVQKLFAVSDSAQTFLLIGIIVASAVASPVSGWLADRFGFKKVLLWILGGWIIIFPLMAVAKSFSLFVVICVVMGLWFGSIWTVTRAYVLHLTPPSKYNQSFTYYTLMERLATFIGPISWGLVVSYTPSDGGLNYRMAALLMTVFVLIGFFVIRKIPSKRGVTSSTS